jgi:hypothetical protein
MDISTSSDQRKENFSKKKKENDTLDRLLSNALLVISEIKYYHRIESTSTKQGQAHEQSPGKYEYVEWRSS